MHPITSRITLCVPCILLLAAGCGDDGAGPGPSPDAGTVDGSTTDDAMPAPDAMPTAVVQCETELLPPASGVCDVTAGSSSAILLQGTILGRDTVYEDGAVLVEGNTITCVGCECTDAAQVAGASVVNCGTAVVSPGLINPHDHITFTETAPVDHGATRYEHRHGWRGSLSTPQNRHGTGSTGAGTRWGELRMLLGGATAMVGSGGAAGLVRNLDRLTDADTALGFEEADFETFSLGDSNETFHANCGWNYKQSELEVAQLSAFLPHVAEGIDNYAAEEFRCQSTSFDGGHDYVEKNVSHIHAIGLQAADYYRMARDASRVIWSPRSNISLYGMTAQVTTFARLGGVISLGTDWAPSGSMNVLRELACADLLNGTYYDGYFSDKQLWDMTTYNASLATGSENLIGALEVEKLADIAIFAAAEGQHHRAVIEAGVADVALVMRDGDILYGEQDTLTELGYACENVDVCDSAKAICASAEFGGTTYQDIATEVATGTAAYPAFFCDVPDNEPTCVPSRPNEFTGAITADDSDGDGIPDASDNCPKVFNPVRPIDGGEQPDADRDGLGDPCDPSPIPDDLDQDGVDNAEDNCPFDGNAEQTDGDSDNKGDDCDFCPDLPNPDSVCPASSVSVVAIQNGTIGEGTRVIVQGLVVTATWGLGFMAQDPGVGPAFSGIAVFTGSAPSVTIGEIVDVEGDVQEYFGDTQIANVTVTPVGTGGVIVAADLTVAEATSEDYEGVLVRLTDAAVTDDPYDCGVKNTGCADPNLWRVGGAQGIVVYDRCYQDADFATQRTTPITGVMTFRWETRRIMPRTAADFGN